MTEYILRDDAEKALLERCKETGYGGLTPDDIRLVMRTPWRIPAADVIERNQWIPVTERLPENGEYVLCFCRANIVCVLRRDKGGDWYENPTHVYMSGFVTHWMPLPEPPESDE